VFIAEQFAQHKPRRCGVQTFIATGDHVLLCTNAARRLQPPSQFFRRLEHPVFAEVIFPHDADRIFAETCEATSEIEVESSVPLLITEANRHR